MSRRQEASDDEDYLSNEEGEFSDSEAGSLEKEDVTITNKAEEPENTELSEATQRLQITHASDQEHGIQDGTADGTEEGAANAEGRSEEVSDEGDDEAADEESEQVTPTEEDEEGVTVQKDEESPSSVGDPASGSEGSLDMRALDEELEDGELEKKEPEPFDVPTGGSFWLHDDRMLDDGTQQRAPRKPKKLWAEEDESSWQHDRYNIPPAEDTYMGFLERKRGGRGGRGGRGRRGGEDEAGYDCTAENGGEAADSSHEGDYGYAPRGRGPPRGRGRSRGRGGPSGGAPGYSDQPAPGFEGANYRGRGSRGGRGGRGRARGAYSTEPASNASQGYGGDGYSNGYAADGGAGRGARGAQGNRGRGRAAYGNEADHSASRGYHSNGDGYSSGYGAERGGRGRGRRGTRMMSGSQGMYPVGYTPTTETIPGNDWEQEGPSSIPAAAGGGGWDNIAAADGMTANYIQGGWDTSLAADQTRHAGQAAAAQSLAEGDWGAVGASANQGGWDSGAMAEAYPAQAGYPGHGSFQTQGGYKAQGGYQVQSGWDAGAAKENAPVRAQDHNATGGERGNVPRGSGGGRYGGRGRGRPAPSGYNQNISANGDQSGKYNQQQASSTGSAGLNSSAQEWPSLPTAQQKVTQNGTEQQSIQEQEAVQSSSGLLNASAQDYRPALYKEAAERLQNSIASRPRPTQPQGGQFYPQQPYLPAGIQPYVPLQMSSQHSLPALGIPAMMPYTPEWMPVLPQGGSLKMILDTPTPALDSSCFLRLPTPQGTPYIPSGFVPPPMQQPAYAPSMPVKRPIPIEAPPERQGEPQQQEQHVHTGGGRRYSAMTLGHPS